MFQQVQSFSNSESRSRVQIVFHAVCGYFRDLRCENIALLRGVPYYVAVLVLCPLNICLHTETTPTARWRLGLPQLRRQLLREQVDLLQMRWTPGNNVSATRDSKW